MRLFAGYCERRGLDHPEIAAYLEYLWRFISLPDTPGVFRQWAAGEPPLVSTGLGCEYPPGFGAVLAARGVPEGEFRRAISCATEVLYGSLYGASDEWQSRRDLGDLAALVGPLGVPLPDLRPFAASRWADKCGWGERPSADEIASWRVVPDAHPEDSGELRG